MKVSAKWIPCDCGGKAFPGPYNGEIKFRGGIKVQVKNFPAFICENRCGEVFYDGPSLIKLEKKVLGKAVTA